MLSRSLANVAFTCTSFLVIASACTTTTDRPPPPPLPNIDPNRPPVVRPRDAGGLRDLGVPPGGDGSTLPPPPPGDGGTTDPDLGIPVNCGNGTLDEGEQCDDGNTERLDGCAACQILPAAVAQYIRLIIDEGMDGIDDRDRMRWCDLDEDGQGDNALAEVGMQIVLDTLFNPDTSMHSAWVALVFDGLDLSVLREGGSGADESVQLAGVVVTDANDNTFDNFTGVGEFLTAPESFAADGTIRVGAMSVGPMSRFRIDADRLAFSYRTMDGMGAPLRIDIRRATIEGTLRVTDDGSRIRDVRSGSVCGAISIRSFLSIPSPVDGSGATLAEDLVRGLNIGGFVLPPARPDIDLDDDGLEQFEIVDGNIEACIDGDGTRIAGSGCIMDLRIADGLSIFATFSGPGARVMGAAM
ncbi:MAG: DUF4215 domain-containing protein [Deltaproteobacteria bacterium]|nr:DUF4215 domain-containing protein [Deltaproteobacteria bacterium]